MFEEGESQLIGNFFFFSSDVCVCVCTGGWLAGWLHILGWIGLDAHRTIIVTLGPKRVAFARGNRSGRTYSLTHSSHSLNNNNDNGTQK